MPTQATTASRKTSARSAATTTRRVAVKKTPDAIALLRADHKKVNDLFEQFKKTRSAAKKKQIVSEICLELSVHAQIEEEILYPEVQAALKDKEMVPEARVEHQSVKDLIAAVEGVEPDGEDYDAKITVMGEWVKHHVKEEQNEMFPKVKKSKLDLVEMGERLQQRKDELMAEKMNGEMLPH
ncbi:hemerythrin domain-containing protein [Roseateles depolymerans]|uniref:Hemerythrin HHE cation binding domain protein n=1 Tax=Roseateles depolymerans TaxID=76731 RepID=A0A0U3MKE6_9BURK|nr:hemerythrin domain-containing protein [Roseateles depolymerans]ALV09213.1 Hemerythrin HHE cation binding domain protein [Roseateles depolymerans]REG13970.1 hemerythrin HHE cation binding domain-containing protein [Roseateles depolymerans]